MSRGCLSADAQHCSHSHRRQLAAAGTFTHTYTSGAERMLWRPIILGDAQTFSLSLSADHSHKGLWQSKTIQPTRPERGGVAGLHSMSLTTAEKVRVLERHEYASHESPMDGFPLM